MTISGNDIYYGHDHIFSPVVAYARYPVTPYDYRPIERYEYNAYGEVTIYNYDFSQTLTASLFANPYYFTGRWIDTLDWNSSGGYDLEIMYYRNRYYDTDTGRFLTHDPLDYVDGLNLYEYVKNSPLRNFDPQGLGCIQDALLDQLKSVIGSIDDTTPSIIPWISLLIKACAAGNVPSCAVLGGITIGGAALSVDDAIKKCSGWTHTQTTGNEERTFQDCSVLDNRPCKFCHGWEGWKDYCYRQEGPSETTTLEWGNTDLSWRRAFYLADITKTRITEIRAQFRLYSYECIKDTLLKSPMSGTVTYDLKKVVDLWEFKVE